MRLCVLHDFRDACQRCMVPTLYCPFGMLPVSDTLSALWIPFATLGDTSYVRKVSEQYKARTKVLDAATSQCTQVQFLLQRMRPAIVFQKHAMCGLLSCFVSTENVYHSMPHVLPLRKPP